MKNDNDGFKFFGMAFAGIGGIAVLFAAINFVVGAAIVATLGWQGWICLADYSPDNLCIANILTENYDELQKSRQGDDAQ